MSLYKDPNSPHWYASICVNGKRTRCSTGTSDRKEAQRIHDQIKAGAWERSRSGITWDEAAAEWFKARQRSKKEAYRLRALNIPNIPLADLTASAIEECLSAVPPTHNREMRMVNAVLNLAKRKGHIDTIPPIDRKKESAGRIRWLTQYEWERLYAQLPPHLKPLAMFAITTGLRQHNVLLLEWSQVDMKRKVAWIHADQAKAGKPIGIPLSDDALEVLKCQRGLSEQWVFPYKGRPLGAIGAAWGKAKKRAGIEGFRWHDLRHTWATWHVQAGTPLEVLMKLGGWSSMTMVLKYSHFAPDYLQGWANNAKPYSREHETRISKAG